MVGSKRSIQVAQIYRRLNSCMQEDLRHFVVGLSKRANNESIDTAAMHRCLRRWEEEQLSGQGASHDSNGAGNGEAIAPQTQRILADLQVLLTLRSTMMSNPGATAEKKVWGCGSRCSNTWDEQVSGQRKSGRTIPGTSPTASHRHGGNGAQHLSAVRIHKALGSPSYPSSSRTYHFPCLG
jgi:hypothetical protein